MDLTKRFHCDICNREFSNITRHQKNCQKRCIDDNRFKGRAILDRKSILVKCSKCGLDFANINRHKKLCKGPLVLSSCPFRCGKDVLSINLEKHKISCQKKINQKCQNPIDKENRFKGRGVLVRKSLLIKCSKCGLDFANINRHIKLCNGPLVVKSCPFNCGKEIISNNLERHKISCKKRNQNFTFCSVCKKSVRMDSLIVHSEQFHKTDDEITLEISDDFNFLSYIINFDDELPELKEILPDILGPQQI